MPDTSVSNQIHSESANPESAISESPAIAETGESFGEIFSQYEKARGPKRAGEDGGTQIEATVIAVTADSVILDIGFKSEGILPLAWFEGTGETVKSGSKLLVSVKGRNPEGYYVLSRTKVEQPKDWTALEKAFNEKSTIVGKVTGLIKGGFSVDVGVRAFMPASRSGVRDAAEMAKLVDQEIMCRIIKLDVADEDLVVDRRVVMEEEERSTKDRRYAEMKEGDQVRGTVRSLTDYGAFVDLGGVDALLHVSDISWTRINKAADVLSVGQQVDAKVLKISNEGEKRRISIGLKQLLQHPWDAIAEKYKVGERVRGTVTRVMEFGAFVELEPGIEGLIHVSEMSWGKKLRSAGTLVKPGEMVDAMILGINIAERRMALGLKQALGDPWADVAQKFPAGSVVEGPIVSMQKFGVFVQLAEGVEGMIHIGDLTDGKRDPEKRDSEKRINHPQEVVRLGQVVKAQVLAVDNEKRQLRLGMKQLVPSDLDDFIAEHKEGDVVSGRVTESANGRARVELGESVLAECRLDQAAAGEKKLAESAQSSLKADLSSLGSMLQARWKGNAPAIEATPDAIQAGQVRKFRITKLDHAAKKIELQLA